MPNAIIFGTTVLFKINVNRLIHVKRMNSDSNNEKLFNWTQNNWTLFIFLQGSMSITCSQLRVRNCLCTKVKDLP